MPLIGFGGAPFTLAAYAIEGGPSTQLRADEGVHVLRSRARGTGSASDWRRRSPTTCWRRSKPVRRRSRSSTRGPARSSRADYREFALPHTRRIFDRPRGAGVPLIHFGVGTTAILRDLAEAGGDVIGVDWRLPIDEAWAVDRPRSRRAGQSRSDAAARPARPPVRRRRRRAASAPADAPGTSSTSATACCPARRSSASRRSRATCTIVTRRSVAPERDVDRIARCNPASSLSAAASPVSRRRTSSRAARCRSILLEASAAARRTDPDRAHRRLHDRSRGPIRCSRRSRRRSQLCEELGLGPRLISTTPPRTAYVLRERPSPSPAVAVGARHSDDRRRRRVVTTCSRRQRARSCSGWRRAPTRPSPASPPTTSPWRRSSGAGSAPTPSASSPSRCSAASTRATSNGCRSGAVAPRLVAAADGHPRGCALAALMQTGARPHRAPPTACSARSAAVWQELVDALAGRIPADRIERHARVTDIARDPASDADAWSCTTTAGRHRRRRRRDRRAGARAARLLEPLDAGGRRHCAQVPYVSTASVALALAAATAIDHPLDGSGFVVARRHSDAPDHRVHVGVVEVGRPRAGGHGAAARVSRRRPRSRRGRCSTTTRSSTSRSATSAPCSASRRRRPLPRVYRWQNAGAQHRVGHRREPRRSTPSWRAPPGLFVAGSGFDAIGIPDCIADGRARRRCGSRLR